MSSDNPKHRAGVQNHVAGLPELGIVTSFDQYYADVFRDNDGPAPVDPEASNSHPIPIAKGIR